MGENRRQERNPGTTATHAFPWCRWNVAGLKKDPGSLLFGSYPVVAIQSGPPTSYK